MYARGMTTRDIHGHLEEIYGVEVSPDLISHVTNDIVNDMQAWQTRPLDDVYPIVFFDAIRLKIRDDGRVCNKAVYLAIGVDINGQKDVLGIWIEKNEGAKFWLSVFTELKNRGMNDVLIACEDGFSRTKQSHKSLRSTFACVERVNAPNHVVPAKAGIHRIPPHTVIPYFFSPRSRLDREPRLRV